MYQQIKEYLVEDIKAEKHANLKKGTNAAAKVDIKSHNLESKKNTSRKNS